MAILNPDVENYIAGFPPEVQKLLEQLRETIRRAAPDAEETINYGIPTFMLHGNLVHYAAFKNHIGFYPAPSGLVAFKNELTPYKGAKGSVQFPMDQPLPWDVITGIVKFRVKENLALAESKGKKKVSEKVEGIGKKKQPSEKKTKLTDQEQVTEHIQKLEPELGKIIETIRQIILGADDEIGEQIKWNNPSFYFTGEMKPFDPKEYKRDIVVMNLHKGRIMLVFPTGAKLSDSSGLLGGSTRTADGWLYSTTLNMSNRRKKHYKMR